MMEKVQAESRNRNFVTLVIIILVFVILVLLFLLSPLKELVFPSAAEPELTLAVIENIGPDATTGLYRVLVEARVEGNPEPQVTYNRNDGIGDVEANHTLIYLREGETFLLTALAVNSLGSAEVSLELTGGMITGALPPEGDSNNSGGNGSDSADEIGENGGNGNGNGGAVAEFGSISGNLSYPSDFIPALRVTAFGFEEGSVYFIDTIDGQGTYQIDNLPPGNYHVVAYPFFADNWGGGYTQLVLDGLEHGFADHTLLPVTVVAGEVTEDIDPADWYAPDDTFPPRP